MTSLGEHLARHGIALVGGATCLLALACLAVRFHRRPIHRQRLGEMGLAAVLLWTALAIAPLPRLAIPVGAPFPQQGNRTAAPSPQAATDAGPRVVREEAMPRPPAQAAEPVDVARPATLPARSPSRRRPAAVERSLAALPKPAPTSLPTEPAPLSRARERIPETIHRATAQAAAASATASVREDRMPGWQRLGGIGVNAYLVGGLLCLTWLLAGRALLAWVVYKAKAPEPWIRAIYDAAATGSTRRPRLVVSARTRRAMSFGIVRPVIVLPEAICVSSQAEGLRHVLQHEWAHVQRRDACGQLLFNLAFPLLYFHPLYWWLRAQVQMAAELIADDHAAALAGKRAYARSLIDLARQSRPARWGLTAHGVYRSSSQFFRRMQMLLSRKSRLEVRCSWAWRGVCTGACLGVATLFALLVGARPLDAQGVLSSQPLKAAAPSPSKLGPEPQRPATTLESRPGTRAAPLIIVPPSMPSPEQLLKERDQLREEVGRLLERVKELDRRAVGKELEGRAVVNEFKRPFYAPSSPESPPPLRPLPPGYSPGSTTSTAPAYVSPSLGAYGPARSAPTPSHVPGERVTSDGSALDVVALANSWVDAERDLSIARLQQQRTEQLAKAAIVSSEEAEIAAIKLKAAERRMAILRRIAESALEAASMETEMLEPRIKAWELAGVVDPMRMTELKIQLGRAAARRKSLEEILKANPAEPAKGAEQSKAAPTSLAGPEAVMRQFLEALRMGDEQGVTAMLTPLARQKVKELKFQFPPRRGNPAARFEVGKVEPIAPDASRVHAKWTDQDEFGHLRTSQVTWTLRKESEGWRVTAMTATVFDGEPPLLVDFEQPEDTMRRIAMLRDAEERREKLREEVQKKEAAPRKGS